MHDFDPYSNRGTSTPTPPSSSSSNQHKSQTISNAAPATVNINISSFLSPNQIQFFLNQGYTFGLLKTLLHLKSSYFQRCWIIDNGSNMLVKDSHRLIIHHENQSGGGGSIENEGGVSRWDELLDCLANQVWISSNLNVSMRFAVSTRHPFLNEFELNVKNTVDTFSTSHLLKFIHP